MWIRDGATVRLVDCTFTNNNVVEGISNRSVIYIDGTFWHPFDEELAPVPRDTIVRLDRCTFEDNNASNLIAVYVDNVTVIPPNDTISAHVLSDDNIMVLHTGYAYDPPSQLRSPEPLSAAPAGRPGITGTSDWLQRIQRVRTPSAFALSRSYSMARMISLLNMQRNCHCFSHKSALVTAMAQMLYAVRNQAAAEVLPRGNPVKWGKRSNAQTTERYHFVMLALT
jgi:hypothetical protein